MTAQIQTAITLASWLIGKPYAPNAQGPDVFDCYGLVRFVRRELFGDDLPEIGSIDLMTLGDMREVFATAVVPGGWSAVEEPSHGAVALMGHRDRPAHLGIFLAIPPGPGSILHADHGVGVQFQDVGTMRLAGWGRFRWYAKV